MPPEWNDLMISLTMKKPGCCGNHWSQRPIETQTINLKGEY